MGKIGDFYRIIAAAIGAGVLSTLAVAAEPAVHDHGNHQPAPAHQGHEHHHEQHGQQEQQEQQEQHEQHEQHEPSGPTSQQVPSHTPTHVPPRGVVPALTDRDRSAVLLDTPGHAVHDQVIIYYLLIDRLEWQQADAEDAVHWDLDSWIGGDIHRLWLRAEGERSEGETEEANLAAFYGRAISPWWDLLAGVRQDFKPDAPQAWAALGIQGEPLYEVEVEATVFYGEGGQSALELETETDVLLTNRLILQPVLEASLHGRNDPERGIGAGLSSTEFGLRLRYEVVRQFAPYLGVSWERLYGNTADYARAEGDDRSESRLVAGVRMWF